MHSTNVQVSDIVAYKLLARHLPRNAHRLWMGKVVQLSHEVGLVWVSSLEEGYAGLEECLLIDQIVYAGGNDTVPSPHVREIVETIVWYLTYTNCLKPLTLEVHKELLDNLYRLLERELAIVYNTSL